MNWLEKENEELRKALNDKYKLEKLGTLYVLLLDYEWKKYRNEPWFSKEVVRSTGSWGGYLIPLNRIMQIETKEAR